MGIGGAFHVSEAAILGRRIIDGVLRREVLPIRCDGALFHVNGKCDVLHGAVDLRDAIVFQSIRGT